GRGALEDHGAAVTAVGAVGSAQGLELLAPDGDAPVAAVAARDVEGDAIDELSGHGSSQRWKGRPAASRGGRVRTPRSYGAHGAGTPERGESVVTRPARDRFAAGVRAQGARMLTTLRPPFA